MVVFNFLGEIFSERSFWRMIIFKLISCPSFQNNEIDQNQPKSTDFEQIRKVIAFKNCRKSMIFKQKLHIIIFRFLLILSKNKHFYWKIKGNSLQKCSIFAKFWTFSQISLDHFGDHFRFKSSSLFLGLQRSFWRMIILVDKYCRLCRTESNQGKVILVLGAGGSIHGWTVLQFVRANARKLRTDVQNPSSWDTIDEFPAK